MRVTRVDWPFTDWRVPAGASERQKPARRPVGLRWDLAEALNCELCYPPPTLFRAREGEQPKDAAFMAETRHIASSIHRLSLSLFVSTFSFLSQSL